MKLALQKSPISVDHVFEAKVLTAPHFDPDFHFHPEYQLFVVLEGTGTRFIGDHVSGLFLVINLMLHHLENNWPSTNYVFHNIDKRYRYLLLSIIKQITTNT